jgi:hypothetical protein
MAHACIYYRTVTSGLVSCNSAVLTNSHFLMYNKEAVMLRKVLSSGPPAASFLWRMPFEWLMLMLLYAASWFIRESFTDAILTVHYSSAICWNHLQLRIRTREISNFKHVKVQFSIFIIGWEKKRSIAIIRLTRSSGKNESPTLLWYDSDRIENDASNNFSIVACEFLASGTCLLRRCLVTIGGCTHRHTGKVGKQQRNCWRRSFLCRWTR